MTTKRQTKTAHLYLFDRFADWEIGLLTAHLNSFEGQLLPSAYRVVTVGVGRDPVISMGGSRVTPDATLDELDPQDSAMLILPGGLGWERGAHTQAVRRAREFVAAGVPIAAICGATFALAQAGLLDDRRHTSNAKEYLAGSGYAGTALYQEELAVRDRLVITANSTGVVDFATEVFRELELYPPDMLSAWHGLFKTGQACYFGKLIESLQRAQT